MLRGRGGELRMWREVREEEGRGGVFVGGNGGRIWIWRLFGRIEVLAQVRCLSGVLCELLRYLVLRPF